MNNKNKTLIFIILFAVLMIGSSILYNNLSTNFKPDSLVVENHTSDTAANESDNPNSNTSASEVDTQNTADAPNKDSSAANNKETSSDNSSEKTSSENKNKLTKAPNFTVCDLAGNEVNLTDFFGKPIIINFWASWCGPCQMEMPDFDAAYTFYKDDIEFLMVNMTDGSRETIESASSFIAELEYDFPVYYDTEYSAAITYSITSLPTTYFINADGEAVAHARGAIDASTLQKGISMIYPE